MASEPPAPADWWTPPFGVGVKTVTDANGYLVARCTHQDSAQWLCDTLNRATAPREPQASAERTAQAIYELASRDSSASEPERKDASKLDEVTQDSRGNRLYVEVNEVGGHRYWSDEVGGGVVVWDTSLVSPEMLQLALAAEAKSSSASERVEGQREAFEKWAKDGLRAASNRWADFNEPFDREANGNMVSPRYLHTFTQGAWLAFRAGAAWQAALSTARLGLTEAIDSILIDVAELPDRTSPEDAPDHMLVSAGELRAILIARLRGNGGKND